MSIQLLLLVVLYLVIAGCFGKKKKNRKRGRSKKQRGQTAVFGKRGPDVTWFKQEEMAPDDAPSGPPPSPASAAAAEKGALPDRHAQGEEPCHPAENWDDAHAQMQAKDVGAPAAQMGGAPVAQDMLRGVVMSEILTRPCERAAMRRNGRRYHG